MRVTIEHENLTRGIIFTRTFHMVHVRIDFSDEELAIINKRGLWKSIVFTREEWDDLEKENFTRKWTIKDFSKGVKISHPTLIRAKEWEDELRREILPNLKGYIEGNAAEGTSSTFEL
jgi:hypothetical protein